MYQLRYFKKCADHHKAWDSVYNIYWHAMAMELVWPYVDSVSNPSVNGFLDWAKNQNLTEVRLEVYDENTIAKNSYLKAGFKPNLLEMRLEL